MCSADRDLGRRQDRLTTEEHEELKRLRREVKSLREEREILKSRGLVRSRGRLDPAQGFEFVRARRAAHRVTTLCRTLGHAGSLRQRVLRWLGRPVSARAQADAALGDQIRAIHDRSRGTYGAPRVHAELAALDVRVGRRRIARLLRAMSLMGACRRKWTATTKRDRDARPAPDRVERNFTVERSDQLWIADITYIPTWAGFLYLAVVIDAWSRRVVGWAMATHLRAELVLDALDMACHFPRA